jgi:hypothetical protein
MLTNLRNNDDGRHRMNFIPLSMKRVLHISSDNTDVRTHGRQRNAVRLALAGSLGIRLCDWKLADNLEHQVSILIVDVA